MIFACVFVLCGKNYSCPRALLYSSNNSPSICLCIEYYNSHVKVLTNSQN